MMKELLLKYRNFILIVLCTPFFSCTINAPVINESKWDITVVKDLKQNIIYETLSIFINCTDDDGENDIATLMFIADKSEFYWELDSSTWDSKYIDDIRWIGSESLVMPKRDAIPRVPIRLFVRDLAGEHTEDKLYITKGKIDKDTLTFPELIVNSGKLSIKNYNEGVIYLYSDDVVISGGDLSNTPRDFDVIFGKDVDINDPDIYFYIVAKDDDLTLKSGPWYY